MTEVSSYLSRSLWDGLLWIVTFSATVLVDVDLGLIIGILFSFLIVTLRSVLPSVVILVRLKLPTTTNTKFLFFSGNPRAKFGLTEKCTM